MIVLVLASQTDGMVLLNVSQIELFLFALPYSTSSFRFRSFRFPLCFPVALGVQVPEVVQQPVEQIVEQVVHAGPLQDPYSDTQ